MDGKREKLFTFSPVTNFLFLLLNKNLVHTGIKIKDYEYLKFNKISKKANKDDARFPQVSKKKSKRKKK